MTYENDLIARYLAIRVIKNNNEPNSGMTYERALETTKTTKEAIDWWIAELTK